MNVIKVDFIPCPYLQVECVLWPSAQVFNFYFLPPHLRVVYVCAIATVYDAFLSFMKYEVSG